MREQTEIARRVQSMLTDLPKPDQPTEADIVSGPMTDPLSPFPSPQEDVPMRQTTPQEGREK